MTNTPAPQDKQLLDSVRELLSQSRQKVVTTVNTVMVQTYWQIGYLIVEHEQQGESRAEYGKALLKKLSESLTTEFGKGFDMTNLRFMRSVYLAFPIRDTLCHELSWSHYRTLSRIENEQARLWYMKEAIEQSWSVRALSRQIGTLYYERQQRISTDDGDYYIDLVLYNFHLKCFLLIDLKMHRSLPLIRRSVEPKPK